MIRVDPPPPTNPSPPVIHPRGGPPEAVPFALFSPCSARPRGVVQIATLHRESTPMAPAMLLLDVRCSARCCVSVQVPVSSRGLARRPARGTQARVRRRRVPRWLRGVLALIARATRPALHVAPVSFPAVRVGRPTISHRELVRVPMAVRPAWAETETGRRQEATARPAPGSTRPQGGCLDARGENFDQPSHEDAGGQDFARIGAGGMVGENDTKHRLPRWLQLVRTRRKSSSAPWSVRCPHGWSDAE